MLDYRDLIDDHDRIDALAEKLELAVADEEPRADVDDLLARLSSLVDDHLSKEDSFIYPDIVRCDDPAVASGLVMEFEVLKRDWGEYLAKWQAGLAANDWRGFRHSTLGMLHRLRERVMKETALLYSMALREGLITMQSAPAAGAR